MASKNDLPAEVNVDGNSQLSNSISSNEEKKGLDKPLGAESKVGDSTQENRSVETNQINLLEMRMASLGIEIEEKRTMSRIPDDNTDKPVYLHHVGHLLQRRYNHLGKLQDLNESVEAKTKAASLTPDGHPRKPMYLCSLGDSLQIRFERLGQLKDIDESVEAIAKAASLTPDGHPSKPMYLSNLAASLQMRFENFGQRKDIDESIEAKAKVVILTPDGHPSKPASFSNLGNSLRMRFESFGELKDINESVEAIARAVSLTPDSHPNKALFLGNLGASHAMRAEHLGETKDLDSSADFLAKAISLLPDGHPSKSLYLSNLGNSIRTRFERLGELKDLDKSVDAIAEAISLTPDNHPRKCWYYSNLSTSLLRRFEQLGQIKDINDSVEAISKSVFLAPNGHPDKPLYFSNLSTSLSRRFQHLGQLKDIDESIEAIANAISLTQDGRAIQPGYFTNLGCSLLMRFERLRQVKDIDESITASTKAVSLVADGHSIKPRCLSNLNNSLYTRFKHLGQPQDLEKSLEAILKAISDTSDGHPSRPIYFHSLGDSLRARFEHLGELEDINESVDATAKAVSLTPDGHANKPAYFSSLGSSLRMRFDHLGRIRDIDESVEAIIKAVSLTPDGHPNKSIYFRNLGTSYRTRFKHVHNFKDRENAILSFQASSNARTGHPQVKLESALAWAGLVYPTMPQLFQAFQVFIDLIPQTVWIGESVKHRYDNIRVLVGDSINKAAAAAIIAGENDKAIEWLEQGRSIVWAQLLSLRTPLDDLKEHDKDLAERLEKNFRVLEQASMRDSAVDDQSQVISLDLEAHRHRRLAEERERLITEIRKKPGFETFLQPKHVSKLADAASDGPVIVINIDSSRCDALVLRPGQLSVRLVPLPNCSLDEISQLAITLGKCLKEGGRGLRKPSVDHERLSQDAQFAHILSVLWSKIVQPVLEALGYLDVNTSGDLLHVTWCPTGPLSSLPIHAAGIYTPTGPRIYNYIFSSYTPTLTTLLPTLERIPFSGILAISQTQGGLKKTKAEVENIQTYFGKEFVRWLHKEKAIVKTVLEQMANYSWVHFACHARQKIDDPLSSAFILHDKSLSLADIMKHSFKGEFAFLSACETATGDTDLSHESLHLAASMMTSGYSTVIATLWSIRDDDAPIIVQHVYSSLYNKGKPDRKLAAKALHDAVAHLRSQRRGDLMSWVPFVHMGA